MVKDVILPFTTTTFIMFKHAFHTSDSTTVTVDGKYRQTDIISDVGKMIHLLILVDSSSIISISFPHPIYHHSVIMQVRITLISNQQSSYEDAQIPRQPFVMSSANCLLQMRHLQRDKDR